APSWSALPTCTTSDAPCQPEQIIEVLFCLAQGLRQTLHKWMPPLEPDTVLPGVDQVSVSTSLNSTIYSLEQPQLSQSGPHLPWRHLRWRRDGLDRPSAQHVVLADRQHWCAVPLVRAERRLFVLDDVNPVRLLAVRLRKLRIRSG